MKQNVIVIAVAGDTFLCPTPTIFQTFPMTALPLASIVRASPDTLSALAPAHPQYGQAAARRWLWLALLPLALGLTACGPQEVAQDPVRSVKLMQVEQANAESNHEYAGEVRARTETALGFRVGGKLLERHVEVGQAVRAGQLLATLDPQDFVLGVQAAEAQVVSAQSQRDQAAADLQRFRGLLAQGFVSPAEIERRTTALNAAEATLRQARAQADVQRNQSGYTRLLASASGVVVGVGAEPGQVVASGTPVVRVALDGPRDVVVAIPEDRIAAVRPGQPAEVWLAASGRGTPAFAARVREVAAAADPLTRTFAIKLTVEAPAGPDSGTVPLGSTATVRLGRGDALAASAPSGPVWRLPTSALWQKGNASAVWVFDAATNTVSAREVQVAGLEGNDALILSGLQAGEEVVRVGVHVLTEGQQVVRYAGNHEPPAPAAAPSAAPSPGR